MYTFVFCKTSRVMYRGVTLSIQIKNTCFPMFLNALHNLRGAETKVIPKTPPPPHLEGDEVETLEGDEVESLEGDEVKDAEGDEVDILEGDEVESLEGDEVESFEGDEVESLEGDEVESLEV